MGIWDNVVIIVIIWIVIWIIVIVYFSIIIHIIDIIITTNDKIHITTPLTISTIPTISSPIIITLIINKYFLFNNFLR